VKKMRRMFMLILLVIIVIAGCTRVENQDDRPNIVSEEQAASDADEAVDRIDAIAQGLGEIEELTG
jgi:hypothetical protein